MAPLGLSGGSQFSSTVLPVGVPVTVSIRGAEGAENMAVHMCTQVHLGNGKCAESTHTQMLNEGTEKQDTLTYRKGTIVCVREIYAIF